MNRQKAACRTADRKKTARKTCSADGKFGRGIVAIASSTGGPAALSVILSGLSGDFPVPIVIAQHISDGFERGMAEWLDAQSEIDVVVAADGERLQSGTAYICPPEKNMRVSSSWRIMLLDRDDSSIYRPSGDVLLRSVAESFSENAVGVILSGMGDDGVAGIAEIRKAGGWTVAQDEKTSVIFGMPGLAIEKGAISRVLPLECIGSELSRAFADTETPEAQECRCS